MSGARVFWCEWLASDKACSREDSKSEASLSSYMMLFGKTPFQDSHAWVDLFERISKASFETPSVPRISESGRAFIARLLQLDPNQRPSAIEALRDPWLEQASHILVMDHTTRSDVGSDVPGDSLAPASQPIKFPGNERMAPGDDGFRTVFMESGVRVAWDEETRTLQIVDPRQVVFEPVAPTLEETTATVERVEDIDDD
jgi:serine/threonine protein kinase